jgi:hypothetical protein
VRAADGARLGELDDTDTASEDHLSDLIQGLGNRETEVLLMNASESPGQGDGEPLELIDLWFRERLYWHFDD